MQEAMIKKQAEGTRTRYFFRGDSAQYSQGVPLQGERESRTNRIKLSYRTAVSWHRHLPWFERVSWVTWMLTIVTIVMWCITAYQVALAAGAHSLRDILANVFADSQNANVLVAYGAKYNDAIIAGQYWRFVTPIFLHANILHVSLNMLNLVVLGIFVERIFGHIRFLLIYLVTGVLSVTASFYFAPQEISVGASGAIFGLVGAYSIFVLAHRRALRGGGIPALVWLVCIIGANLSVGFFIADVDNFAHIGGLLSGFLLGWWFMPRYVAAPGGEKTSWMDLHSFSRRWPLALLTILGTILLAMVALHFTGG